MLISQKREKKEKTSVWWATERKQIWEYLQFPVVHSGSSGDFVRVVFDQSHDLSWCDYFEMYWNMRQIQLGLMGKGLLLYRGKVFVFADNVIS